MTARDQNRARTTGHATKKGTKLPMRISGALDWMYVSGLVQLEDSEKL